MTASHAASLDVQETSLEALYGGQAGGFVIAQVLTDIFTSRFDNSTGAIIVLGFVAAAVFLGGLGSTTVTSRQVLLGDLRAFGAHGGGRSSPSCFHRYSLSFINSRLAAC